MTPIRTRKNAGLSLALLLGFCFGLTNPASHAAILSGATSLPATEYIAFGASMGEGIAVTLEVHLPDGRTAYTSGFRLNDDQVMTAAHNLFFNGTPLSLSAFTVLDGTSYLADPGEQRSITQSFIAPSYAPTTGLDIAILQLSAPLLGRPIEFSGPVPLGAMTVHVGSGRIALPYGEPQVSGTLIGWQMQADTVTSGRTGEGYAGSKMMTHYMSSYEFPGVPAPGDSGSVVFYNNKIAGFVVQAAGGNSGIGDAIWVDLSSSQVQQFIASVPEPGVGLILSLASISLFSKRRRQKAARGRQATK